MLLLCLEWGWLPISGLESIDHRNLSVLAGLVDHMHHVLLPILVGAVGGRTVVGRYMRGSALEVVRQDCVTAARARGLGEARVIWVHVLRSSLLPFVTLAGFWIPALIGGNVIPETVFVIPGLVQLFYWNVMARD